MNAVGLGAGALLVANEVSSGDGATIAHTLTGASPGGDAHGALVRLGLMIGGVVVLAVMAGQSSPWPALAGVILVGLAALWAIHTFSTKKGAAK